MAERLTTFDAAGPGVRSSRAAPTLCRRHHRQRCRRRLSGSDQPTAASGRERIFEHPDAGSLRCSRKRTLATWVRVTPGRHATRRPRKCGPTVRASLVASPAQHVRSTCGHNLCTSLSQQRASVDGPRRQAPAAIFEGFEPRVRTLVRFAANGCTFSPRRQTLCHLGSQLRVRADRDDVAIVEDRTRRSCMNQPTGEGHA